MGVAGLAGGLLGAAGSFLQAREARASSEEQMEFEHNEAILQREWLERMSNTAHQREVADLHAAGLNPILSATGGSGASVPVGASAHAPSSGVAPKPNFLASFVGSAKEMIKLDNEVKQAEAAKINADAQRVQAETAALRQKADERHIDEQINSLKADIRWKDFMSNTEEQKVKLVKEQIVSEIQRRQNDIRLTDAKVIAAGAVAYQAVKMADTEAAYKSKMAEVAEAKTDIDRGRLKNEADKLRHEYEEGLKNMEIQWYKSNPKLGQALMTVEKIVGAVSPIKFSFKASK